MRSASRFASPRPGRGLKWEAEGEKRGTNKTNKLEILGIENANMRLHAQTGVEGERLLANAGGDLPDNGGAVDAAGDEQIARAVPLEREHRPAVARQPILQVT